MDAMKRFVRGQVARHLTALGCEVSAYADGHDALDALAGDEPVDLLMTDINMPGGLNGRQLADHARLLDPTLRVLFLSYLERVKEDETYITNRYPIGDLKDFAATGVLVNNGE